MDSHTWIGTDYPTQAEDSGFPFLLHVSWMCLLAAGAIAFSVAIGQGSGLEGGDAMQTAQHLTSP